MMPRKPGAAGVLLALALLLPLACRTGGKAERIFVNGRVITMNERAAEAHAFAVDQGKIVAVGSDQEMRARFAGAEEVDLQGQTVMPGIVESHGHLLNLGLAQLELNIAGVATPAEVAQKVKERAAQTPPGEWIIGWGWDEGAWAASYPTNEQLNQAAPHHPVWLKGLHGFAGWANAPALEIARITKDTPDPANGRIIKDARTGAPTGILTNQAQALLTRHIPPPAPAQMQQALLQAQEECLKHGLTTVHDARVSAASLAALRTLAVKGQLKIRVYAMLDGTDKELLEDFFRRGPELDPAHWLVVRSIKVFADGALGSRGAALFEPYSDRPDTRGVITTPTAELTELTARALTAGFQIATHAIGDRGNRDTLDAYEAALKRVPAARDPRLRIEHAQVVALGDIPRFAQLKIVNSMQPPHCTSDLPWAEARIGPERIKGAYAWRRFLDAGVRVALNSDFPGETLNPFAGMYAAETRQTPGGQPAGGWYPAQRLTRQEVLRAYTIESAYAGFEEGIKGQIAPEMLADFTVLSDNIATIPARALLTLRVERTYVGGKLMFELKR
jgi:predicted amidohydrolase YtcJ